MSLVVLEHLYARAEDAAGAADASDAAGFGVYVSAKAFALMLAIIGVLGLASDLETSLHSLCPKRKRVRVAEEEEETGMKKLETRISELQKELKAQRDKRQEEKQRFDERENELQAQLDGRQADIQRFDEPEVVAAAPPCTDLEEAQLHLPRALQLLTVISRTSMMELAGGDDAAGGTLEELCQRVSALCAQVQLDADQMNPRWNKSYGKGGTLWQGELDDSRSRGGLPYYCPEGWTRFSLKVCPDAEFEDRFKDWGYLYHGTKGRFVGSILTSGLRSSSGSCYCGAEDNVVYMSPSIEYCAHPRYSSIHFDPRTRRWVQIVLQCRVSPNCVAQKRPETMKCGDFNLRVDPHFDNSEMEWLFEPNWTDPSTGCKFMKDMIVCTGLMLRITEEHPVKSSYWWTSNSGYMAAWGVDMLPTE